MDCVVKRYWMYLILIWLSGALLGMACAGFRPYPRYQSGRTKQNRLRILSVVNSYLGTPYQWGGENRRGLDCSGLVVAVFREALSLSLPHNTQELFQMGETVKIEKIRIADLLFFGELGQGMNHVGISLGEDRFVHASEGQGVTISRLSMPYFGKRYRGARRILR